MELKFGTVGPYCEGLGCVFFQLAFVFAWNKRSKMFGNKPNYILYYGATKKLSLKHSFCVAVFTYLFNQVSLNPVCFCVSKVLLKK